ncbi:heterokaryon incompatibility protein-domain-containing protein [Xylaria acuta]|nr:heterokaryon incompatibility protein-domain-containing protein [Xylaria acuta]
MDTFEYQQIDLESSAFRLVRLFKGAKHEEIECELIHTTLDENVIPYEAVSYTWGTLVKRSSIKVQGRDFKVTSNLWNLLGDLRHAKTDRYLWIDAISINQTNDLERGHQIRRMQGIYSGAESVLFYLGETTENISRLMDSLSLFRLHISGGHWAPGDERCKTAWRRAQFDLRVRYGNNTDSTQRWGLRELLKRPWFRRVWVLQEVANARTASVCCGAYCIPVRIFAISPILLEVNLDSHSSAVFRLMPTYIGKTLRKPRDGALFPILVDYCRSEASDPRDKIFALLGLCREQAIWEDIAPNYAETESAIIRATIRHMVIRDLNSPPEWISTVDTPPVREFFKDLDLTMSESFPEYMKYLFIHMLSFWNVKSAQPFLGRKQRRIEVTLEMIDAAASNRSDAVEMMSLLLQHGKITFDSSFLSHQDFVAQELVTRNDVVHYGIHNHLLKKFIFILRMTTQSHAEGAVSVQRSKLCYLISHVSGGYLEGLVSRLGDKDMKKKLRLIDREWDEEATKTLQEEAENLIVISLRKASGFDWWAFFTIMVLRGRISFVEHSFAHWLEEFDTGDDNVALYFAMYHRHQLATRRLLEKGTTIILGRLPNPLSCALHRKDPDIVNLLRAYSANIVGCDGRSPLHCAAEFETIPVIRFLLEQGADPDAVDKDGLTALQVARVVQRPGVVHLLEAAKYGRLDKLDEEAVEVTEMGAAIDHIINEIRMSQHLAEKPNTAWVKAAVEARRVAREGLRLFRLPVMVICILCFFVLKWWDDRIRRKRAW